MSSHANFIDIYGNPVVVEPHRWTIATASEIERLPWRAIDRAGEPLSSTCREYTRNRLLTESPIEARNVHAELRCFARFYMTLRSTDVPTAVLQYLAYLTSRGARWRWARIRAFYRYFALRGQPGFNSKALVEIDRIVVGGNPKGEAVRTRDPLYGPMSQEESTLWKDAIRNDDDDSYAAIQERVVAILLTILGLRPASIVHLMESDLIEDVTIAGTPVAFALEVPRAKKRVAPRTLLRRIPVHARLAREIKRLIRLNRQIHPQPVAANERPILFAAENNPDFGVRGWQESSSGVWNILQRAVRRYNVISPRTQRRLKVFPTRLRRSAATALAREGYSARQIAAYLDHEDLQHVTVYTDAASGTIEYLDAALAESYAPFFDAFKGAIPTPSSQHERTKTVSYVSDDGHFHLLGGCGQKRIPCELDAPYACYGGCELFEPFSDADHDSLLRDLLARRAEFGKSKRLAERRLATLLDRTIFGLAHVKLIIQG